MPRVVVITGAVGALGSSLSRLIVASGHRVAGVGLRRHEERLRRLEEELGAGFAGFALEEDSTAAWDAALGAVQSRLGAVHGAALVAGGWSGGRPFHEERDDGTWGACTARRRLRTTAARRCGSRPRPRSRRATVAKSALVALARVVVAEVLDVDAVVDRIVRE